jgi:hypothetical protein
MHRTAQRLEVAEASLHRSAEESPNADTTARRHAPVTRSPSRQVKSTGALTR